MTRTCWRGTWKPSSRPESALPGNPRRMNCPPVQSLTTTNRTPASTNSYTNIRKMQLRRTYCDLWLQHRPSALLRRKNSFYQSIFRCKNWSMHNKLRRSAVGLSDGQRRNTLCRPMCSCYSFHWGWTWPIDNPNLNPADYRWFEVLFSSGCIYPDGRRSNSMKNCSGLLSH